MISGEFLGDMTKSSKLIATLGVVAGLGVAALPLGSVFAAQTQASVSGNVDLYVEVQPAIAMTITGNNDNQTSVSGVSTTGVDVKAPTNATTIDTNTTATAYDSANLQTSSSFVGMLPNAFDGTTATSTVTIFTNNTTGYGLSVLAETPALQLKNGNSVVDSINAGVVTTDQGGDGLWSYKLSTEQEGASIATGKDDWTAVTSAATPIASAARKTTGGDAYTVNYGVSTKADQSTGVYSTTLTYTATTVAGN